GGGVGSVEELVVGGPVLVPGGAQRLGGGVLAGLGDVVLLDHQLALECRPVLGDQRRGSLLLADDDEQRGAVQPLDGLLHPLRGQHAPVVVGQDPLAGPSQGVGGEDRHHRHQHHGQRHGSLGEEEARPQRHSFPSPRLTTCTSRSVASCTRRTSTVLPSKRFSPRWCERPTSNSPTLWLRAKSSSAGTGSVAWRRTTSAPSSRASSMFSSKWRWASASMRVGASLGVST